MNAPLTPGDWEFLSTYLDGQLTEAVYPDEGTHWERLQALLGSQDLTAMAEGSIIDWAMEAHALAREAYETAPTRPGYPGAGASPRSRKRALAPAS